MSDFKTDNLQIGSIAKALSESIDGELIFRDSSLPQGISLGNLVSDVSFAQQIQDNVSAQVTTEIDNAVVQISGSIEENVNGLIAQNTTDIQTISASLGNSSSPIYVGDLSDVSNLGINTTPETQLHIKNDETVDTETVITIENIFPNIVGAPTTLFESTGIIKQSNNILTISSSYISGSYGAVDIFTVNDELESLGYNGKLSITDLETIASNTLTLAPSSISGSTEVVTTTGGSAVVTSISGGDLFKDIKLGSIINIEGQKRIVNKINSFDEIEVISISGSQYDAVDAYGGKSFTYQNPLLDSNNLVITSDEYLGMGTKAPITPLHIKGTSDSVFLEDDNAKLYLGYKEDTFGLLSYNFTSHPTSTDGFSVELSSKKQENGSTIRLSSVSNDASQNTTPSGEIEFLTTPYTYEDSVSEVVRATINTYGNFGIGENKPLSKLHISDEPSQLLTGTMTALSGSVTISGSMINDIDEHETEFDRQVGVGDKIIFHTQERIVTNVSQYSITVDTPFVSGGSLERGYVIPSPVRIDNDSGNVFRIDNDGNLFTQDISSLEINTLGDANVVGNITTSSNISASGNIITTGDIIISGGSFSSKANDLTVDTSTTHIPSADAVITHVADSFTALSLTTGTNEIQLSDGAGRFVSQSDFGFNNNVLSLPVSGSISSTNSLEFHGGSYQIKLDSTGLGFGDGDYTTQLTSSASSFNITSADGQDITLDASTGTNDTINLTSSNVVIEGNLTVNGSTTTVNSTTVEVSDSIFVLSKDASGAPITDAGLEVERGTSTNAQILWNEVTDTWQAGISGNISDIIREDDLDALTSPIATTGNISGSAFYGDGSNLSNLPPSGLSEGDLDTLTSPIATTGNISGASFYGDGSNLTGVSGGSSLNGVADETVGANQNGVRIGNISSLSAQGNYAVAEGGYNNSASGNYSHAEGGYNQASGNYSHAEGYDNKSIGNYSHAEGRNNEAVGNFSHAEGRDNFANGISSHVEGANNYADGTSSHAEGDGTRAEGANSHAEGVSTLTEGANSHAEGDGTRTYSGATNSHAEGRNTTTYGINSHAEGYNTRAYGDNTHAGGLNSYAYHDNSFVWSSGFAETTTDVGQFRINTTNGFFVDGVQIDTNGGGGLAEGDLDTLSLPIATTGDISGASFYGDGSNLTGIYPELDNVTVNFDVDYTGAFATTGLTSSNFWSDASSWGFGTISGTGETFTDNNGGTVWNSNGSGISASISMFPPTTTVYFTSDASGISITMVGTPNVGFTEVGSINLNGTTEYVYEANFDDADSYFNFSASSGTFYLRPWNQNPIPLSTGPIQIKEGGVELSHLSNTTITALTSGGLTEGDLDTLSLPIATTGDISGASFYGDGSNLTNVLTTIEQWTVMPATETSTGIKGQRAYESGQLAECVATNTWVFWTVATVKP